jgi:Zn-finger protein
MKRKSISTRRRFELFKRDGFTCQYCGKHPPNVVLHLDHILAVANGGDDSSGNLVTSCADCNLGKSAVPLSVIPQSLADQAAVVAEREAQLKGYAKIMRKAKQRLEDDAWEVANVFMAQFRSDSIRKDWFRSIQNFVDKLGVVSATDAMEAAIARCRSKDMCFRYFCGICWNRIREAA